MNLSVTLDVNESSLVHLVQVTSVLDGRKGTIRNDSNKRWLCFEWKRVSKWILGNPTKFHPKLKGRLHEIGESSLTSGRWEVKGRRRTNVTGTKWNYSSNTMKR